MPRRSTCRAWARVGAASFAIAGAAVCGPARADSVTLHNGDRLTGRILHMSPGTLVFETTWAGELKIPRYEVRSIETDKPVTVLRERSERTESVMMKPAGPGSVSIIPAAREDEAGVVPAEKFGVPPAEKAGAPASAAAGADPAGAAAVAVPGSEAGEPAGARTVPIARLRYLNPKPEESGEGVSYKGRATLAGTFSRGNSTNDRIYAEGDFGARAREWRYALTGKVLQEGNDEGTTASNWILSGNFDRFLDDDGFLYVRGAAERDRFRDIAGRISVGSGYGRQLLQTDRTSLSLRGGLELVSLDRLAGVDYTSPAIGWGLNVSHRLDTLSAELFHDQRGSRTFGSDEQLSLRSRTGLRVPFVSGLTASLQLNLDWDDGSTASGGADTTWLIGLGYAW